MTILPKITLRELCGPGYVFNARVSGRATDWVFKDDPARADAVTGNLLISIGDMPILCSRDATTPDSMSLFRAAGFDIRATILGFSDENNHIMQTRELIRQGFKMVTQHVFPVDEIAPEYCLVDPSTLSYLNNKANLHHLVPAAHVPKRRVVELSSLLTEVKDTVNCPVVIKAVTDMSSGGGVDIIICRSIEDVRNAAEYFKECEQVVIEDYMQMMNNYCINYAASHDGKIHCIGVSEQIVDDTGEQYGNWIGQSVNAPGQAIEAGLDVMKKAAAMGYVGFAGLDMAVLEDGSVKIFDLNFRYNASTVPLLIYDSVAKYIGDSDMLIHYWEGQGSFQDLLRVAHNALKDGYFIPTNSYNPDLSLHPHARPLLSGLLCGKTREEVCDRNEAFLKQGLD